MANHVLPSNGSPVHRNEYFSANDDFNSSKSLPPLNYYNRQEKDLSGGGQYFQVPFAIDETRRGYIWRRNDLVLTVQQNVRYGQYCLRKRVELDKNTGLPIWSGKREAAFRQGVKDIPPVMFKRKVPMPNAKDPSKPKPSGRNELLAHRIWMITGELLDSDPDPRKGKGRKKISSHIQVINNFLKDDRTGMVPKYAPHTMQMFEQWGMTLPEIDAVYMKACRELQFHFDLYTGKLIIDTPKSGFGQMSIENIKMDPEMPLSEDKYSVGQRRRAIVQRLEFKLSLLSPPNRNLSGNREHVYTTVQSEMGAQPLKLESIANFKLYFPFWNDVLRHDPLRTADYIFLDASIRLIDEPPKSQMARDFKMEIACDQEFMDWEIRTSLYESYGQQVDDHIQSRQLPQTRRLGYSRVKLEDMPFECTWWRDIFQSFKDKLELTRVREDDMMAQLGHPDCSGCTQFAAAHEKYQDAVGKEVAHHRRYIQEMSVMQEIHATRPKQRGTERVAVLFWKFRAAHPGEAPSTTWRKLVVPPAGLVADSMQPTGSLAYAGSHLPTSDLRQSRHRDISRTQLFRNGNARNTIVQSSLRERPRYQHGTSPRYVRTHRDSSYNKTDHNEQHSLSSQSQLPSDMQGLNSISQSRQSNYLLEVPSEAAHLTSINEALDMFSANNQAANYSSQSTSFHSQGALDYSTQNINYSTQSSLHMVGDMQQSYDLSNMTDPAILEDYAHSQLQLDMQYGQTDPTLLMTTAAEETRLNAPAGAMYTQSYSQSTYIPAPPPQLFHPQPQQRHQILLSCGTQEYNNVSAAVDTENAQPQPLNTSPTASTRTIHTHTPLPAYSSNNWQIAMGLPPGLFADMRFEGAAPATVASNSTPRRSGRVLGEVDANSLYNNVAVKASGSGEV